jgi:hypothetical protein
MLSEICAAVTIETTGFMDHEQLDLGKRFRETRRATIGFKKQWPRTGLSPSASNGTGPSNYLDQARHE